MTSDGKSPLGSLSESRRKCSDLSQSWWDGIRA